ncbi:unnamed protein product [Schistosoma margrebowiei]|uniref:Uncharacterized protein n=2 Tax=Schistosoma margrebowiei TaxID=48269 RepID=A0A183MFU8_9TREM|nr:unnamed protein product [Schistosoma margrebowiei]
MVVGGSQQETLDPGFVLLGTRQQGVPVILRELVLPGGFDLMSPSFTVRDVTTELSEPGFPDSRCDSSTGKKRPVSAHDLNETQQSPLPDIDKQS